MPDIIQFKNGNHVINTYNGAGQKLRTKYYTVITPVIVPVGTIHGGYSASDATLSLDDYMGSVLYEKGTTEDAANHPLTKLLTPEGYVDYATPGKPYCYFRKDHLGSIREVDTYLGNDRKVVQKTQYYPSGTPFAESFGAGEQPYKFTGKEMITMHGLNWQDYGARWLDNVRLQFTSMDPLAENNYSISPYAYCSDNPAIRIDPDGMEDGDSQPIIPTADKSSYTGNAALIPVTFTNNAVVSAVNSILSLPSAAANIATKLYNEGPEPMIYNLTQGVEKFVNTSPSEHFQNVISSFSNVNFWEDFAGAVGTMAIGGVLTKSGSVPVSEAGEAVSANEMASQVHHFATNKNKLYTPQMENIANKFGLDLDGEWNKASMPHLGRHPNAYHNFVLRSMQDAAASSGGSQTNFLKYFNINVKQPVLNNPSLLNKSGWKL